MIVHRGFHCREGTYDKNVINENVHCYNELLQMITTKDIVFDIGANIGCFTRNACMRNPNKVYAFEPDHDNFTLLKKNTEGIKNIHHFYFAVITGKGAGISPIDFYKNTQTNKGSHSQYIMRGREKTIANGIDFQHILNLFNPTLIKMDCEYAEYDLLNNVVFPRSLKAMIVEFHLQGEKWRKKAYETIEKLVLKDGLFLTKPFTPTPKAWHKIAMFVRP